MQRLEVSGAVRPIYGSLGVKRLMYDCKILEVERNTLKHQIKSRGGAWPTTTRIFKIYQIGRFQ